MSDTFSPIDRRAARRQQRTATPLLRMPFRQPRNPMAPLEVMSGEQIEAAARGLLRIFEETGLDFMDAESLSTCGSRPARAWTAPASTPGLDRALVLELDGARARARSPGARATRPTT